MASAQLFLSGARVTAGFREALHDAANRAGVTPNEFVITAAAEKLAQRGASFTGVFRAGDMTFVRDNRKPRRLSDGPQADERLRRSGRKASAISQEAI